MNRILQYEIDINYNGATVERFAKDNLNISTRLFNRLKLSGCLQRNGLILKSTDILHHGDCLTIIINDENPSSFTPYNTKPDIVFEDEDIAVVNKSANMHIHPCGADRETTLGNAMLYHWQQMGEQHIYRPVTRLDKNTSGLCIIAKNQYAHALLSQQLIDNIIIKKYIAIVHGKALPNIGTIDFPIGREPNSILKRRVSSTGQNAVTLYHVLEYTSKFTILEIETKTGRTHQIRVHLSHLGHPLVGDWLYGYESDTQELLSRHALHAFYLGFKHPINAQNLEFDIPLPIDMKKLIEEA